MLHLHLSLLSYLWSEITSTQVFCIQMENQVYFCHETLVAEFGDVCHGVFMKL